ncbi:POTE ankyrin domain family member J-like isoform X2 [Stylophora pistillata]|uniref:POTE ankyrin domain family member J-like isoform X2 n=1 Tax=Stylophora pistillata TaxID=50429 RepID=UPI000C0427E7|nr:POTE ankyrin domain family member J-like isoform X2 [Stylophora pistillata]
MTLWKLVCEGRSEELRQLLEESSDEDLRRLVNKKFGQNKMTALHKAIEKGYEGIIKLLLEKGADISITDHHCRTALHIATSNETENIGVVELILRRQGVGVDALDEYGNTSLKLAAEKGHCETVELLMSKGADVNKADKVDNTPLHVAVKNGHDEVLEKLLKKAAKSTIGKQTKDKCTALHHAVERENERCVALLLKYGAGTCIESKNEQGRTPLDLANDHRNQNILKLLKGHIEASEFLERRKARLGEGASVESDSSFNTQTHPQNLVVGAGIPPQLPLNGVQFIVANNVDIHQNYDVKVQNGGSAAIGPGARINSTQANTENAPPQQMHNGGAQYNVDVTGGNAAVGDNSVLKVNTGQSRTPSTAGSSDSQFNFPEDQENRDPHDPETGSPVENSQEPSEASLPSLEESRGEVRGASFRSFQEEPPSGEGEKSLAQPFQEEFPSEKGSGGLFHPVQEGKDEKALPHPTQEESPGDKSTGALPLAVLEVPLPEKKEELLAQPVQEECQSDKDNGSLPLSIQGDSSPGQGNQSLPQPAQEEARKDKDSGAFPLPVQEDSPQGKYRQLLARPVQEEAPRDEDRVALPIQIQGDSSCIEGDKSLPGPVQEVFHRDGSLPYPIKEEDSSNTADLLKTSKEGAATTNQSVNSAPSKPAMFKRNPATGQTWQTDVGTNTPKKAISPTSSVGKNQDNSILENVRAQSKEGVFPDGNHRSADGGPLHRVPLSGGSHLFYTSPRNREAPHRTERHSRDNPDMGRSQTAAIDMGDVDSHSESVQDENPDDDKGGPGVCNCRFM